MHIIHLHIISYTSFQVQLSHGKMFAQMKFYVHTDFEKLEWTLILPRLISCWFGKDSGSVFSLANYFYI